MAGVAELFAVSRQAVYGWVETHAQGGVAALAAQRRGRPTGTRLTLAQSRKITGLLRDRRPEQLKLPFYLWTREAVVQWIGRECRVQVSVWTAGRYLKAWGFTPQKPVRRALERDPQAVAHWLQVEYPAIRVRAKRARAEIYWGDEMGVRSDQAAGRSFSPRGETPVIPGTGQRFGCNQISALTN
ncbi:Transposase, partial [mine drainage metagenome]